MKPIELKILQMKNQLTRHREQREVLQKKIEFWEEEFVARDARSLQEKTENLKVYRRRLKQAEEIVAKLMTEIKKLQEQFSAESPEETSAGSSQQAGEASEQRSPPADQALAKAAADQAGGAGKTAADQSATG